MVGVGAAPRVGAANGNAPGSAGAANGNAPGCVGGLNDGASGRDGGGDKLGALDIGSAAPPPEAPNSDIMLDAPLPIVALERLTAVAKTIAEKRVTTQRTAAQADQA